MQSSLSHYQITASAYMKKIIATAACLLFGLAIQAQQNNLAKFVASVKQKGIPFEQVPLLSYKKAVTMAGKGVYRELQANMDALQQLISTIPYAISVDIPVSEKQVLTAELAYVSMGDYKVKLNNATYTTDFIKPVHYRGVIKNRLYATSVTLTLTNDGLTVFVADEKQAFYINNDTRNARGGDLILYNDAEISLPQSFNPCGLKSDGISFKQSTPETLLHGAGTEAASDKCIYAFLDCTNGLFIDRSSSVQNVLNYITAIFNDVSTAYQNETINMKISEINIWQSTDPFLHTNRDTALYTFANYYKNNFYGNVAVMVDRTGGNGISGLAGGFGKQKSYLPNVCGKFVNDQANKYMGNYCVCDMNYFGNYINYPTPANSEQVYMITHEIGHLVNGRHTHDGGYVVSQNPYTLGSLDTCGAKVKPTLGLSITNGTFMSYCIYTGMRMNFNAGFGTQPGNEIRAFISGETCLDNCPGCVVSVNVFNVPGGATRYEVSSHITAAGVIPSTGTVHFDAGNYVDLKPGFVAGSGSRVVIFIEGCGGIR